MSDQTCEVPLVELLLDIPKDLRAEWEIQWFEDGTPSGHAMCPVGNYAHRAAERIKQLEAENRDLIQEKHPRYKAEDWLLLLDAQKLIEEMKDSRIKQLEAENAELKAPTITDHNITEIIPTDQPKWAKKAMREGRFFSCALSKIKELEEERDGYEAGADAEAKQVDEQFEIITKLRTENSQLKKHLSDQKITFLPDLPKT